MSAVVYYLQCNSLARFGAVSRRRCVQCNSAVARYL